MSITVLPFRRIHVRKEAGSISPLYNERSYKARVYELKFALKISESKSAQEFKKRMDDVFSERGRIAELVRKTGLSRRVMEKWRDGVSIPTLDSVDRVASALNTSAWELIRPSGAQDAPQSPKPDLSVALAALDDAELGLVLKYIATLRRVAARDHALSARKKKF